tara:strand:- start:464 stop:3349 length:2886 start_codon:yes stop_codon:yes gene_type:complete
MMDIKRILTPMENKNHLLVLLFITLIWNTNSQTNADKAKNRSIPLDTTVRYGKLDNGFTYYLKQNIIPKKSVEFHMVGKVGTYHEDEDQLEYAHLLEHMGANGTKNFPVVKDYFRGAGRYTHAKTGGDGVSYYVRMPANDKEGLVQSLQLILDWAQDIKLDQKSVDMQRGAVLGEMRNNNNPYQRWLLKIIEEEVLKGTGYKSSNRLKRKASIQNFNRQAFIRYYEDWYRPDLQAAIIVGDINLDSMELKVKHMFSDLKMPKNPRDDRQKKIDAQTIELNGKNRYSTVIDTLKSDFRMYMISKRMNREFRLKTEADYREMLLQQLYLTMVGTKGKQLNQQYNPPFSKLSMNFRANSIGGQQINATSITIDFESDTSKHIKKQLVDALIAWKRMHIGFKESALSKAKEMIFKDIFDSQFLSSSWLAVKYRNHFVKGMAAPGLEEEKKIVSKLLEQINLNEVQHFILDYGDLNKNTNFLFFKGKEGNVPDYKMVEQWVKEVIEMKVKPLNPPKPPITSLANASQIPIVKNAKANKVMKSPIGVTTVVLKNGIKLLLKPTKPAKGNYEQTISIDAYRSNKVPIKKRTAYLEVISIPQLIRYTGAGSYTKFDLDKYMLENNMKLKFETDKNYQMIKGETKVKDMGEWFNLLYLYLTKPRQNSEGFLAWKTYETERLNGNNVRGSSEFYMDEVQSRWFPEVPILKMQDLNKFKMKNLLRTFKKWYSDIEDYTFIITGDFDTEKLVPVLVKNLSGFPVKGRSSSNKIAKHVFPLHKMEETIRLKNINQSYVRLYFPVTVPKDIKTKIALRLLSKALYDRVWPRLRLGCYAPGAGGDWMDVKNGIYAFWVRYDSELGNEENLKQMAIEEFRKLRQEGVDKEWLEKAIKEEKTVYGKDLDRFWFFNFWTNYLKQKLETGEDIEQEVLQYEAILEHFITLEDINETAKKYLSEENLQQFLVIPEGYQPIE